MKKIGMLQSQSPSWPWRRSLIDGNFRRWSIGKAARALGRCIQRNSNAEMQLQRFVVLVEGPDLHGGWNSSSDEDLVRHHLLPTPMWTEEEVSTVYFCNAREASPTVSMCWRPQ